MIWVFVGIIIGAIVGLNTNYLIPLEYIKYTAVATVAILDVLSSGIKAEVNKTRYSSNTMIIELVTNIAIAIAITYLGEKVGLDLYLATTFVFIFKIFSNLGIIRQKFINKEPFD